MYMVPWSDDEFAILKAHWEGHGKDWIGWESLLPGRTPRAIQTKANRLGMVEPDGKPKKKQRQPKRKEPRTPTVIPPSVPDPYEHYVMACMEAGLTPRQIDQRMHWRAGTAALILTEKWGRENEQED